MQNVSIAFSWCMALVATVPLAIMLILVLPSGMPAQIAMHALLLVAGAAITIAVSPEYDGALGGTSLPSARVVGSDERGAE
jgi:hypothetical protein